MNLDLLHSSFVFLFQCLPCDEKLQVGTWGEACNTTMSRSATFHMKEEYGSLSMFDALGWTYTGAENLLTFLETAALSNVRDNNEIDSEKMSGHDSPLQSNPMDNTNTGSLYGGSRHDESERDREGSSSDSSRFRMSLHQSPQLSEIKGKIKSHRYSIANGGMDVSKTFKPGLKESDIYWLERSQDFFNERNALLNDIVDHYLSGPLQDTNQE